MLLTIVGCVFCLGVMVASVGAVLLSMYVVQVTAGDDEVLDLDSLELAQTSIIYDKNGDQYATLTGDNNRIWMDISKMPEDLKNAVVAIEDKDFYSEFMGVNFKRTIAAVLNEFTHNRLLRSQQGASTIEQQLIKNLTGDNETDYMRKVREIFRAMGLARRYSKETVLEAYLNTISLTGQINGMEVGANEYFGKTVSDLSLAECATLASITKNPMRYNPYTNPENLKQRRNYVLGLMRDQGKITEAECAAAQAEPVILAETHSSNENVTRSSRNSWFTDALYEDVLTALMEVRGLSESEAKAEIFSGGLRIEATVDPKIQESVENIMLNQDDELFPALWRREEVESSIPADSEITYDELGLPLNPDGSSVFAEEDIPVYTDDAETTLRTKTGDDGNLIFYESVRTQAAMAVLDFDGNILAVGGGLGEKKYDRGTNRATIPHQTGSTMKPIAAYCRAIDNRLIHYSSYQIDAPLYSAAEKKVLNTDYCRRIGLPTDPFAAVNQARSDVWRSWPENYGGAGGKGAGMLVYDALRQSYNTVAVRVGDLVGPEDLFTFAHDVIGCTYLSAEHDMDLAPMVLGAQYQGLTVVQLAGAYSIFYDGSYTTPHYFTKIYDSKDNLIIDNTRRVTTTQAIRPDTATIMNRLLYNVLHDRQGTAYGMAPELENGLEAVGKTGTTSDYKDYNFCGMTPYYVAAVWWGYDKPADLRESNRSVNGKPTQRAWKRLMEEINADLEYKEFPMADNVVTHNFDTSSGNIISSGGRVGYYTEDNMDNNNISAAVAAAGGTIGVDGGITSSGDPATEAANQAYLDALRALGLAP